MITAFDIVLWSAQVVAFLIVVLNYKSLKKTSLRYFIMLMSFVLITEFFGFVIPYKSGTRSLFVYNIFTILSISFYLYWFYSILDKGKKWIPLFIGLFLISVFYAIVFENFYALWKWPLIVTAIVILASVLLYYEQLLNEKEVLEYYKIGEFWVSTGLLIFYIGFLPLFLMQERVVGSLAYKWAITILNVFMYGFFTIGFLCRPKT